MDSAQRACDTNATHPPVCVLGRCLQTPAFHGLATLLRPHLAEAPLFTSVILITSHLGLSTTLLRPQIIFSSLRRWFIVLIMLNMGVSVSTELLVHVRFSTLTPMPRRTSRYWNWTDAFTLRRWFCFPPGLIWVCSICQSGPYRFANSVKLTR